MKKVLLMPILAFLLYSCSHDDKKETAQEITGPYWMDHSSGSIAGGAYDFDFGVITWTFDPVAHKVTIKNNNTNPEAYDGPDSGTYSYHILDSNDVQLCEKLVMIDNASYGCYVIDGETLSLTNNFADGYVFHFKRPMIAL